MAWRVGGVGEVPPRFHGLRRACGDPAEGATGRAETEKRRRAFSRELPFAAARRVAFSGITFVPQRVALHFPA